MTGDETGTLLDARPPRTKLWISTLGVVVVVAVFALLAMPSDAGRIALLIVVIVLVPILAYNTLSFLRLRIIVDQGAVCFTPWYGPQQRIPLEQFQHVLHATTHQLYGNRTPPTQELFAIAIIGLIIVGVVAWFLLT